MEFGRTAKVLAECKLKYYRILECNGFQQDAGNPHVWHVLLVASSCLAWPKQSEIWDYCRSTSKVQA